MRGAVSQQEIPEREIPEGESIKASCGSLKGWAGGRSSGQEERPLFFCEEPEAEGKKKACRDALQPGGRTRSAGGVQHVVEADVVLNFAS